MSATEIIEHEGIVKRVTEDSVIVSILKNSGCASCLAKDSCNLSESEEKEIEIKQFDQLYSIGEKVKVYFNKSLGFKALFLGYILPFLLVLSVLIITSSIGLNEGRAGLLSIGILLPYYFGVYLAKSVLKKTFTCLTSLLPL